MDKKKVKEYIQRALVWIDPMTTESANYETAIEMAAKNLEFAMEELSKSDWVSVEDRQPPKNAVVQVCNKQNPDDVVLAYRTNKETMKIVYPSNVAMYSITHWKPIEKLDKIK